jgi:predicted nucleotidyltransferase component of viral defense system/DNA-directed RNA polymerase subunit RPC12/RpoP
MIDRREILDVARDLRLQAQVVEKDYVLGWLLAGIYSQERLHATWVFKGGTCLKKCYFETYRFSEDLDFTLTDESHLDTAFLMSTFADVAAWVYERTGIEIPAGQLRFDVFRNPRNRLSCEGRVYYRGPIAPSGGSLPRIKLDLSADELLVKPPVERAVAHPYSDAPSDGLVCRCYDFDEVFAEKLRALGERGRPRDLYDVVNLFRNGQFRDAAAAILSVLRQKCSYKSTAVPSPELLAPHREELAADWSAMLQHQLPQLPPFQAFWDELPAIFRWLTEAVSPRRPAAIPLVAGDVVLPFTYRHSRSASHGPGLLEIIRFAAANRICVDLDYDGETRRIEPYSLRRTKDDNVILHAIKVSTGEARTYRLDRIQGARATSEGFVPKYAVELTPSGPMFIPPTGRSASTSLGAVARRHAATRSGPTYVYQCMLCGKKFRRKTRDSSLRDHKTPDGRACGGRRGACVDTEY